MRAECEPHTEAVHILSSASLSSLPPPTLAPSLATADGEFLSLQRPPQRDRVDLAPVLRVPSPDYHTRCVPPQAKRKVNSGGK